MEIDNKRMMWDLSRKRIEQDLISKLALIDLIFMVVFLLPLIIVFKSKEIKQSEYVRELALSELTITFYHYMHTQKLCKKILNEIKTTEIVFSKNSKTI